jgi:hypothetical protein
MHQPGRHLVLLGEAHAAWVPLRPIVITVPDDFQAIRAGISEAVRAVTQ